jgi:hypothetical protein
VIRDTLPCADGDRPELDMCPELAATLHRELDDLEPGSTGSAKPGASWPASSADEVFRAERDAGQR